MTSILGRIVGRVVVEGLKLYEAMYPMPARLGSPLAIGAGAPRDADPVVLVHGFANAPSGWDEWKHSLMADGFDVHVVELPNNALGDMRDSAKALADFVTEVKRRTGKRRVDLVGFSQGGLLARMYVAQLGGAESVDRIVTLATPHRGIPYGGDLYRLGTPLSGVVDAITIALGQLMDGSDLLKGLMDADGPLRMPPGLGDGAITGAERVRAGNVRYASIYSRSIDPLVTPWSANLGGAVNVPVRGDRPGDRDPNHFTMYHLSDRAYEAARLLLLDRPGIEAQQAGMGARTLVR